MEHWNREELYSNVWEHPLTKLVAKYGISAVALGKVCRKLKIPLPGRGYWAKKEFGKPVKRIPLPAVKDLPPVYRMKLPPPPGTQPEPKAAPDPTDAEWLRIKTMESRVIPVPTEIKYHKLVAATSKSFSKIKADERGLLQCPSDQLCLDIRVSNNSLERALKLLSMIIEILEAEGFPVTLTKGRHTTGAQIFGHRVQFELVEKTVEKGRREVKEYGSMRTIVDYEPGGRLEFRVGEFTYSGQKIVRDGKTRRLEELISHCVAAAMSEGRDLQLRAERLKQEEIERQRRASEQMILAEQIREEEKKVQQLEQWVELWSRARLMREFVFALEKVWAAEGHDLSPEAPKGQRLLWMKQQADRLDPMGTSPPSILDRKTELNRW